jgi:2-polyprenyl-6-methoxyphenol hydroxylase-like FAD-dependent oxidoreductase
MSGLFTAAFLRQVGWDVDVYERSTVELVGRGAGITTHPELLEALQKCGAGSRDLGVEVKRRVTIDRDGRAIGHKSLRQILTSWDRLQHLLRHTIDAVHYHLGHTFEHVGFPCFPGHRPKVYSTAFSYSTGLTKPIVEWRLRAL